MLSEKFRFSRKQIAKFPGLNQFHLISLLCFKYLAQDYRKSHLSRHKQVLCLRYDLQQSQKISLGITISSILGLFQAFKKIQVLILKKC